MTEEEKRARFTEIYWHLCTQADSAHNMLLLTPSEGKEEHLNELFCKIVKSNIGLIAEMGIIYRELNLKEIHERSE